MRARQRLGKLGSLRGIDTLSAVGRCAEVGDFERFERPGQLMSYLGLVRARRAVRLLSRILLGRRTVFVVRARV